MAGESKKPAKTDWSKLWQELGKKANTRQGQPLPPLEIADQLRAKLPEYKAAYEKALSHFAGIIIKEGEILDEHVVDCLYTMVGRHIETATLHQIDGIFQVSARMYQSVMLCAQYIADNVFDASSLDAMRATIAAEIEAAEEDEWNTPVYVEATFIDSDATRDGMFAELERHYSVPEWARYEFRGAIIQLMQFVGLAARLNVEDWTESYSLLVAALIEATNDSASSRQVVYYPDKMRR
jgi:hypothetical protein